MKLCLKAHYKRHCNSENSVGTVLAAEDNRFIYIAPFENRVYKIALSEKEEQKQDTRQYNREPNHGAEQQENDGRLHIKTDGAKRRQMMIKDKQYHK